MPRHNREDRGSDQRGFEYRISYQPDWLQAVKVTRSLESGRQSTKTLFRNPNRRQQDPGERVRTRITCPEQNLDFEITLTDPNQVVKRVIVETVAPGGADGGEIVTFTLEDDNPPPKPIPPPPPPPPDGGD